VFENKQTSISQYTATCYLRNRGEPKQKFLIRHDQILSIRRIAEIVPDSDSESVTSLGTVQYSIAVQHRVGLSQLHSGERPHFQVLWMFRCFLNSSNSQPYSKSNP